MASATASMPKNQADRLPLSHQSNPQGLMISIDTRGAFFLMLQSQRGSIPGRILTSDGASPDLMDTANNLYDRGGGAYGGGETSFQS